MSDLEQNIPDDFWRKAFEEVAETPPPRVWDTVERRLDEDNGPKVMPLWATGPASSRPLVWGAGIAAAVALLLVGWWALRTTGSETPLTRNQPSDQAERVVMSPSGRDHLQTDPVREPLLRPRPTPAQQTPASIALNQKAARVPRYGQLPESVQPPVEALPQKQEEPTTPAVAITSTAEPHTKLQVAAAQPIQLNQSSTTPAARFNTNTNMNNGLAMGSSLIPSASPARTVLPESPSTSMLPADQAPTFDLISTSALRLREPGPIQRIVWFRPAEPVLKPAADQSKRGTPEMWASVSVMPGAFNPAVMVQPTAAVQASYMDARALNSAYASQQPSVNSRANLSVAYQAGAGIQFTERWSVESGIGYLAGRSTVDSPAQTSSLGLVSANANQSAQNANLYVDALRSRPYRTSTLASSPAPGFSNAAISTRFSVQNNYSAQVRQSLTNDYQFVQVPVQVGYQLRPRKRLNVALLGGFLSTIFVRNTVDEALVITTKDRIYRPVSWAASMGVRFRYRPSRQWSASLAGLYQPSLGVATQPDSPVQARPTSTGLNFGVDYHF